MTKLLLNSGLRRNEICELKINDINKERSTIYVLGKGKKLVEQPISNSLMIELIEYINTERREVIEAYKCIGGKDKGYVFLSGIGKDCNSEKKDLKNGNRVSDNSFYQQIKRFAKKAGMENAELVSLHSLRRNAGTNIYEKTGDINTAKEFLRHSSITTTEQCYINYNRDKLVEAVNNLGTDNVATMQNPDQKLWDLYNMLKNKFEGN